MPKAVQRPSKTGSNNISSKMLKAYPLIAVTRYWGAGDYFDGLKDWTDRMGKNKHIKHTLIGINSEKDTSNSTKKIQEHINKNRYNATPINIEPWGRFTTALNTLFNIAREKGAKYLLTQSWNIVSTSKQIDILYQIALSDKNVLVVGAALNGHEFKTGTHKIDGVTCPWNTFAIWSLDNFKTGFQAVSDGIAGPDTEGIEEVVAISLAQLLNPKLKALLVSIPEIKWDTSWHDKKRRQAHLEKMKRKISRAKLQLRAVGLTKKPGSVEHIGYPLISD